MIESCEVCGFELWHPIAELKVADLALYSDGRFPGRAILRLREHWDAFEELPDELAIDFYRDAQSAIRAILKATDAARVNFAVLGNSQAHVHAHLIPRYPAQEDFPGSSPWDDPRPRAKLDPSRERELIVKIREELSRG